METYIYTNWLLFQPAGYPDSEIPPHATQTPQRQRSSRTDLRLQLGSDCQFQEHSRSFLLGFQRRTSVHGGTAPPFRSQSPCGPAPRRTMFPLSVLSLDSSRCSVSQVQCLHLALGICFLLCSCRNPGRSMLL